MVTRRELYGCPVCNRMHSVDIPVWREDVEGWSYETVLCPVCGGERWLDKDEWAARLKALRKPKVKRH